MIVLAVSGQSLQNFLCGHFLVGKAYGRTLRQHHNWIVRGIFNVSVVGDCASLSSYL